MGCKTKLIDFFIFALTQRFNATGIKLNTNKDLSTMHISLEISTWELIFGSTGFIKCIK